MTLSDHQFDTLDYCIYPERIKIIIEDKKWDFQLYDKVLKTSDGSSIAAGTKGIVINVSNEKELPGIVVEWECGLRAIYFKFSDCGCLKVIGSHDSWEKDLIVEI